MKYFLALSMICSIMLDQINAQSESYRDEIAKCAVIKGELDRLECFDNLAKELGLIPTTTVSNVDGAGKWITSIDTNPLDDSKTITLLLQADEGTSKYGDSVSLVIRCSSNGMDVYINWNDYLGSEASVTSRIGSKKAKTKKWTLSTTKKATFYPANDVSFLREMLSEKTFVAQVTPYNENPVMAVFDISGLSEAIIPLKETCEWD